MAKKTIPFSGGTILDLRDRGSGEWYVLFCDVKRNGETTESVIDKWSGSLFSVDKAARAASETVSALEKLRQEATNFRLERMTSREARGCGIIAGMTIIFHETGKEINL